MSEETQPAGPFVKAVYAFTIHIIESDDGTYAVQLFDPINGGDPIAQMTNIQGCTSMEDAAAAFWRGMGQFGAKRSAAPNN